MIEIFLRHYIFEKCINLIFDGIFKAFKKPKREYEILNVKSRKYPNGLTVETYIFKYKGKIHEYTTSKSDGLVDMFMQTQGYSRKESEREIYDMNIHAIESIISGSKTRPTLVLSEGKNGAIARLSISKTAKNNV